MSTPDAENERGRARHAVPRVHRVRDAAFWAVSLALIVLLATLNVGEWNSPAASGASGVTTGFYLDVGASASLGFQPTGIEHHNGARTHAGYANDIVASMAAHGVDLTLHQVGCPGETTYTMLNTGDHCYKNVPNGSQRKAAIAFLESHQSELGLVTIDLGFNDVRACMWKQPPDLNCTSAGLAQIKANMPGVVSMLQKAAGPQVHFIGMLYADPFLSDVVNPRSNITYAEQTRQVVLQLDAELTSIYHAAGIPVANVPGAYHLDNTTPSTWQGVSVPLNVVYACNWTWMCTAPPFGRDDHPNDAGYRAIADAFVAVALKSL